MARWASLAGAAIAVVAVAAVFFLWFDWLRNVLATVGGLAIVLLLLYLAFPQNAQIVLSHVGKLVAWAGTGAHRFVVKNQVEGHVNTAMRQFNVESGGAMPHPVKVVWAGRDVSPESFLEKGRVIVKLGYSEPAYRNVVNTALLCCQAGLLPETRHYLTPSLGRAIDLEVVDSILKRNKFTEGRVYFLNDILPAEFQKRPTVEPWFSIMEELELRGYFTRILLSELLRYPSRAAYRAGKDTHHEEIEAFAHFLHDIAQCPPGGEVQLDFLRERLRVGVIIVGKALKLDVEGWEPYLRRVRLCADRGTDMVYLIGVKGAASAIPGIARAAERGGSAKVSNVRRLHVVWRDGTVVPAYFARLECTGAQPPTTGLPSATNSSPPPNH